MNSRQTSIFRHRSAGDALLICLGLIAAWFGAGVWAAVPSDAGLESRATIRAAAEDLIRAQLGATAQRISVHAADPDSRLRLAHCATRLNASLLAGVQLGPRSEVRISCSAQGTPWAIYVPVSIESDINVLVLREGGLRGDRVAPGEVITETRHVQGLPVGYITDMNSLPHYTLARSAPPGTALTADLMIPDLVVRSGQQVTLVAQGPGISVSATGRVLQDGREGALVRVQNLTSQKVVQGVVDASGRIQVTP